MVPLFCCSAMAMFFQIGIDYMTKPVYCQLGAGSTSTDAHKGHKTKPGLGVIHQDLSQPLKILIHKESSMLFSRNFCTVKQGAIQNLDWRVKQTGTVYASSESNNVNTSSTFAPSLWRGAFFEASA